MIELIADQLAAHFESAGKSKWTIDQYKRCLAQWYKSTGRDDLEKVTTERIETYFAEMAREDGTPVSKATHAYHFRGMQAVFKWHSAEHKYPNPMKDLHAPRVPETEKDIVTVAQVRAVLKALDAKGQRRNAAMISLAFECGIRRAEIAKIRHCDIDWAERQIIIRSTKNHRDHVIAFGPSTGERLGRLRTKALEKTEAPLFKGRLGGELSPDGVYYVIRKCFKDEGMDYIGAHDLRHSFATAFIEANPAGTAVLKQAGNWKSDTSMNKYTRHAESVYAREAFRKMNPASQL